MYAGGCTYLCSQGPPTQTLRSKRASETSTLFGPHAKFTLHNSPPAVDDEIELMKCMRAKLGPYASENALQYHLRAARGKVFWAVNTYFRAVLAEQVRQPDFEPRLYAHLANSQAPAVLKLQHISDCQQQVAFDSIPAPILENVLQHCDLLTVCNAAAACKSLRQAADSEVVWESLHERRWGPTSAACSHEGDDDTAAQQNLSPWRGSYRTRHLAEYDMQCPSCKQSKIVPIVYGFPSHLLVRNMKANKLRMGNDHLIEGQPIWTCSSCSHEFLNFPYVSLEIAHC